MIVSTENVKRIHNALQKKKNNNNNAQFKNVFN